MAHKGKIEFYILIIYNRLLFIILINSSDVNNSTELQGVTGNVRE